jgi:hypothetical protein
VAPRFTVLSPCRVVSLRGVRLQESACKHASACNSPIQGASLLRGGPSDFLGVARRPQAHQPPSLDNQSLSDRTAAYPSSSITQVLLLDEITVDLDVLGRKSLMDFLRDECDTRCVRHHRHACVHMSGFILHFRVARSTPIAPERPCRAGSASQDRHHTKNCLHH